MRKNRESAFSLSLQICAVKARKHEHLFYGQRLGVERLQIKSLGALSKVDFRFLFNLVDDNVGTLRMASALEVVRVAHIAVGGHILDKCVS
jgi:hypothetical protein